MSGDDLTGDLANGLALGGENVNASERASKAIASPAVP